MISLPQVPAVVEHSLAGLVAGGLASSPAKGGICWNDACTLCD